MNLRLIVLLGMALAIVSPVQAQSMQNLILNGGFETGDFTDYTVVRDPGDTTFVDNQFVPPSQPGPHSGSFYVTAGDLTQATISQTITPPSAGMYRLTYYAASDGLTPNELQVTVGGTVISDLTNIPVQGYVKYSFLVALNGATSVVFGLDNVLGDLSLDDISVTQSLLLETMPGLTPNQMSVAKALDAVPLTSALSIAVSGITSGSQLDQLTPLAFGSFTSVNAFNNASFTTESRSQYLAGRRGSDNGTFLGGNGTVDASGLTVNDSSFDPALASVRSRMLAWNPAPMHGTVSDVVSPMIGQTDLRDESDAKKPSNVANYASDWNFYVRGNVILAQGLSQADIPHFNSHTESVELGVDYRVTPSFIVGLDAAYGHSDATLDNFGSSVTVDSLSPGLYASYADKGWYANLQGNYLHNSYSQDRHIDVLGQHATSSPNGNEAVVDFDGGYDFHKGAWTFGPLAGVQYTHLSVDGYTESGSVADLMVNSQSADSLRSRLGGRVGYAFSGYGLTFRPHLDLSWQHEFLDQSRGITSQFQNGGVGSFSVQTDSPSRDFALADAGLDAEVDSRVNVFLDYLAQAGQSDYFGQSVQGGVKVGF